MLKVNYSLAGAMTVVALFFYLFANSYSEDAQQWPQFFSIILILLSIILVIDTHLKPNREQDGKKETAKKSDKSNIYVFYALIASIIYLLLMKSIGFLILTPIYLWVLLWLFNYKSITKLILIAIGTTLCVVVIFQVLLKIPIPEGILSELFLYL